MHDIFYFTDVHGQYDLYRAAMNFCMTQDPECMVIYGGDACDRGFDGYRIMQELLDNPQVIYLKGNHEDIFVHAAWFIMRDFHSEINDTNVHNYLSMCQVIDNYSAEVQLSLYNGGFRTLYDWMMDGMSSKFVSRVAALPITFSYENLDFCHAGANYKIFKRAAKNEYNHDFVDKNDYSMLLWDRNYISQGWKNNRICVFGHTPTPYIASKYYGADKSLSGAHPCAYNPDLDDRWMGKKIDMDVGTCGSGKLYVLNCLTMKAYGFVDYDLYSYKFHDHDVEQNEVIQL